MSTQEDPARKKRSEQRKRTLTLHCRALPSEVAQIKKLAKDFNMSVSEILRQAALEAKIRRPRKRVPSPDRQALAQLTGQLGKVGSNLNQLARHANTIHQLKDHSELGNAISACRKLIDQLTKLLT